ncbi:MAG: LamG domain-containing protein [Pirellulales bacterium]
MNSVPFLNRCATSAAICLGLIAAGIINTAYADGLPVVGSGTQLVHLKADQANVVLGAGNAVSQWNDLSGLGNNFFQTAGNRQPVWVDNALGGHAVIRFDGASDWLDVGAGLAIGDAMPFTFFAVTHNTTDPFALFDSAPQAQNTLRFGAFGAPFPTPNNAVEFWDKSPALAVSLNASGSVLSLRGYDNATTNRVMEVREISALGTNSSSATGNTNPVVFGGNGGPNIGTINNGGNGFYNGDLAELIIYSGKLSSPDVEAVENYLRNEYSIGASPPPPTAVPSALGNYGQTVLASSPVAFWRLETNDAPPTDSADAAGFPQFGPQNGVYQNISIFNLAQPGPRPTDTVNGQPLRGFAADNKAVDFQGNGGFGDDVALFADDGNLNMAPGLTFSLEAWVKGPPQQEPGGPILAKGIGGGGEQFALDIVGGAFRFYLWDGLMPNTPFVAQSTVQLSGEWQHVAAVFDSAEGLMKLYVNGEEARSITPPATMIDNLDPISVGGRRNANSPNYDLNFDGLIDEVAIYRYALSQQQIRSHFDAAFVPEPGSTALLLSSLVVGGFAARRQRRR